MAMEEEMIDISNMLNATGINVESIKKLNQAGLFRMVLSKHEDAMKATENLSIAKMCLKQYLSKKGLEISFCPSEPDVVGSVSVPISLSLWKDSRNVSGDEFSLYQMSEAFQAFSAGILAHYPSLIHFMAPHHNSMHLL
jgi:glutamine synthetase